MNYEQLYLNYLDQMAVMPDLYSDNFIDEVIDLEILKLVRGDVISLSDDSHTLNNRNLTFEEFCEKCSTDPEFKNRFK